MNFKHHNAKWSLSAPQFYLKWTAGLLVPKLVDGMRVCWQTRLRNFVLMNYKSIRGVNSIIIERCEGQEGGSESTSILPKYSIKFTLCYNWRLRDFHPFYPVLVDFVCVSPPQNSPPSSVPSSSSTSSAFNASTWRFSSASACLQSLLSTWTGTTNHVTPPWTSFSCFVMLISLNRVVRLTYILWTQNFNMLENSRSVLALRLWA